jgi:hypothetical protein
MPLSFEGEKSKGQEEKSKGKGQKAKMEEGRRKS